MEMDAGNLLDKVSDNLSVRRAFGTAYEKDGILIIPVAMVAGGGGGGTGRPRQAGPAADADAVPEGSQAGHEAPAQDSERVDTGGGFGGVVLPAGAYVVENPDGERYAMPAEEFFSRYQPDPEPGR